MSIKIPTTVHAFSIGLGDLIWQEHVSKLGVQGMSTDALHDPGGYRIKMAKLWCIANRQNLRILAVAAREACQSNNPGISLWQMLDADKEGIRHFIRDTFPSYLWRLSVAALNRNEREVRAFLQLLQQIAEEA